MRRLVFSPAAQADISTIWDYTVQAWGADQAIRYNELIEAACLALADGSHNGRSVDEVREGYQLLHVGKHSLYFRQSAKQIEVIRILHQSMGVDAQLG